MADGDVVGDEADFANIVLVNLFTVVLNIIVAVVLASVFNAVTRSTQPFDETVPADYCP
jgi:hypothetical protein